MNTIKPSDIILLNQLKGELSLFIYHRVVRKEFKFEDDDYEKFLNELSFREAVLLNIIVQYKINNPCTIIQIAKGEYYRHKRKKELNIPISLCVILVRSGIESLEEEDYAATWNLLNKIKGKCSFIVFPNINIEN